MRQIKAIIAALMLLAAFATPASAKPTFYKQAIKQINSGRQLTLSIEQGSTGILKIKYIFVMPQSHGRSSFLLLTPKDQFYKFANVVSESTSPTIAELDGTEIDIKLYGNPNGHHLYGRIMGTGERVYVVPSFFN